MPQLGSGPVFPVELLPALIKTFNPDTAFRLGPAGASESISDSTTHLPRC